MRAKFVYVGIRVKNLQQSLEFYTKLLGMKIIKGPHEIKETKGEFVVLKSPGDGSTLELNHYQKDSPHYRNYTVGEGLDHLAFRVDNLDEAIEEAKRLGFPTILAVKTKVNRWAYIKDPNGIWIELYQ